MRLTICAFMLFFSTLSLAKGPYVLHWGINLEPLDFFIPAAGQFKQRVEKRTRGQVRVKLSIGHYLQDEKNHLEDVKNGVYDMGQETVNNLQKYSPSLAVWDLPFLFKTNKQVFAYTETDHAKAVYKKLEELGVKGVVYTYSGGFLHIYGKKMKSFDDLKNKTVAHEDYSSFYKEALNSIYGIKFKNYGDRTVDSNFSEIIASTLYELNDLPKLTGLYLNRTEHRVFSRIIFISKDFLRKLPHHLRKIVLEEAKYAGEFEREMAVRQTENYIQELKGKGVKVNNWSESQKRSAREAFGPTYQKYKEKFGDSAIKLIDSLPN